MNQNDLRTYTVKVNNGSGCLFQSMDNEHTYILTAKHLFQTDDDLAENRVLLDDGTLINLTFQSYNGHTWDIEEYNDPLQNGINFFPHSNPEVDAAIIKIQFREGYNRIHISPDTDKLYYLCGYPGRLTTEQIQNQYDSYKVEDFLFAGNFFDLAKLDTILQFDEVSGMSGGGILCCNNNHINIIGIQSRMANKARRQLGEIGYIPMRYFNEIINENREGNHLQELLPFFLKSFGSLVGDIFDMNSGILAKKKETALSDVLIIKANTISQSDITPIAIKNFVDDKLLLLSDQDSTELQKKKIWTLWFELLTILNIAKDTNHQWSNFESLFKNVRFFYSNTNRDFLGEHLQTLLTVDYSNLEEDGLVVFASNIKSQDSQTKGILKLNEIIPNIVEMKRTFLREQSQFESSGIDIGTASSSSFPYDKYRYTNISTFKEEIAEKIEDEFLNMNSDECLTILKEEYERLITE